MNRLFSFVALAWRITKVVHVSNVTLCGRYRVTWLGGEVMVHFMSYVTSKQKNQLKGFYCIENHKLITFYTILNVLDLRRLLTTC